MTAEGILRHHVDELLDAAVDAWSRGAPNLAERLFAAATTLAEATRPLLDTPREAA